MIVYDALIVGRGIAGNTLALTLLQQHANIKVVDIPASNSASRVAPGLYNPYTGKRSVKTWMAHEIFPFLEQFYADIELKSGIPFLHKTPIYRPFSNLEEYNDWTNKDNSNDLFLNQEPNHEAYKPYLKTTLGGFEAAHAGYIDTHAYLAAGEQLLGDKLLNTHFEYSDLSFERNEVMWNNERFKKIIFCEGVQVKNNPFFPQLPLVCNKGELLHLKCPDYTREEIISRGVFLMHHSNKGLLVGSTYNWSYEHEEPEERNKMEILEKLNKWFKPEFSLLSQIVGIRPASKDRRPFLGASPIHSNVYIFNGLGTKGVSLAPYWAQHLCQHLLFKKDISKDVDIQRFYVN
jgi:glycine oxidase